MLYAWACGHATCTMLPTATQFTAPSASCQAFSNDPMPVAVLVDVDLISVGHMLKWTVADQNVKHEQLDLLQWRALKAHLMFNSQIARQPECLM